MEMYTVITCDIIESRSLAERGQVQKRVEAGFEAVNRRYDEHVAIRFQFTLGDEFQGVLSDASKAPHVVSQLREEIAPVRLRIGMAIGDIATDLSSDIRQVDGPAFHIARDVIEGLKRKQRLTGFASQSGYDDIVNTVYMLYDVIIDRRTERQWQVARAYSLTGSGDAAAKVLGTTPQNISKHIRAAHLSETKQAERFLEHYLSDRFAR